MAARRAVHHPFLARLWSLTSRHEPAEIRRHRDELLPGPVGARDRGGRRRGQQLRSLSRDGRRGRRGGAGAVSCANGHTRPPPAQIRIEVVDGVADALPAGDGWSDAASPGWSSARCPTSDARSPSGGACCVQAASCASTSTCAPTAPQWRSASAPWIASSGRVLSAAAPRRATLPPRWALLRKRPERLRPTRQPDPDTKLSRLTGPSPGRLTPTRRPITKQRGNFRPAQKGQLSTGLDMRRGLRSAMLLSPLSARRLRSRSSCSAELAHIVSRPQECRFC